MATHLTRFLEAGKPGDVGYFSHRDATIVTTATRKGWRVKTTRLVAVPSRTSWEEPIQGINLVQVELLSREGNV